MKAYEKEYRLISLPPFTAATSGADRDFDFSPNGKLGKFDAWFSTMEPSPRDSFMPRDFLFFNSEEGGWNGGGRLRTACRKEGLTRPVFRAAGT